MHQTKLLRFGTGIAIALAIATAPLVTLSGCQDPNRNVASQKDREPPGGNKMPSESRK